MILPDDTNVNQELVEEGWCWWHQNMRQVIRELKGERGKRERPGYGCGPIRSRCCRGRGGRGIVEAASGVETARGRKEGNGIERYDGYVYDFLDLLSMDCCNCLAIRHRQPAADLLVSQQEIRLC